MAGQGAGPLGGTNRVGHQESGNTHAYVCAQRERERSVLLKRVTKNVIDQLCDKLAAGNDFLQVWTNLYYRECFCKTNCWQELHFEFFSFSGFTDPGEPGPSSIPVQMTFWTLI